MGAGLAATLSSRRLCLMAFRKATIDDFDPKGKRVLVRCDFNVPIKNGIISDDRRITESLPTIKNLLDRGGRVVLCSHMGRPDGERKPELSLKPVADRLSELLEQEVRLVEQYPGPDATSAIEQLKDGEACLLENLRYDSREEANDEEFSKELASLADVYVNDAFGAAHRAHASTAGVTKFLPAYSGYLMRKELQYLIEALEEPKRPYTVVLGGAKVADKIKVIEALMPKVDHLLIGGGMAFTFLKAQGHEIGKSLLDSDSLGFAKELLEEHGDKIVLPQDVVVSEDMEGLSARVCAVSEIAADEIGLDIGVKTAEEFAEKIRGSKTVLWNGPMGVFETPAFAAGTRYIAETLADGMALSIVGGGDSASAVEKFGVADRIDHVSTGGGASLELLEGRELPGVAALKDA